jgi:hypothetical protein
LSFDKFLIGFSLSDTEVFCSRIKIWLSSFQQI